MKQKTLIVMASCGAILTLLGLSLDSGRDSRSAWSRASEPIFPNLPAPVDTADTLVIESAMGTTTLTRSGDDWTVVEKGGFPGRGDEVGRLLVALALDHNTAGHIDSAIAVLEQASRTSPRDAVIAGNLGALQIKVGESVAGEANLRRALVLEPGRAEWHGNLGLALSSQGRFVEALEVAQAAMRLEPGNAKWQELVRQLGALRP